MRFLCVGLAALSLALLFAGESEACRGGRQRGWFKHRPHHGHFFQRHRGGCGG